jgi:hypothetical protein
MKRDRMTVALLSGHRTARGGHVCARRRHAKDAGVPFCHQLREGLSPRVEDIIYTTRACIHSCTGARQYGQFGIFAEHASQTLWWPHGTAMCDLGPVMHTMHVV